MTGDGATLSAIFVILALTAAAGLTGSILIQRTRRVITLSRRQNRRGRDHELHWAAIRLRSNGHRGHDLQEMVCTLTNCTPTEADRAIAQVGANV